MFRLWRSRLLLLLLLGSAPLSAHPPESPLKIAVVGYANGVGISRDADILIKELVRLGHQVRFQHIKNLNDPYHVDVNVFLEKPEPKLFAYADKNYLIPNPEHTRISVQELRKYDKILAKTRAGFKAFNAVHPDVEFTSFTTFDRYDPSIEKNYQAVFHLQGGSVQKGSDEMIKVWLNNPVLPELLVLKHGDNHAWQGMDFSYPPAQNIQIVTDYYKDSHLQNVQNAHGVHMCTSTTEGFGHYIWEALSCASVVVTTDAPPMNEFIHDRRCLVPYIKTAPWYYATRYYVHPEKFDILLMDLFALPEEELRAIGQTNRQRFLDNDRFFKQRLSEVFPPAAKKSPETPSQDKGASC